MSVLGIDQITYGAADLPRCRQFFLDWGLALVSEAPQELVFESLNGCRVVVAHSDKPGLPAGVEPDPTLREVVWAVDSPESLALYRTRLQHQPGFEAFELARFGKLGRRHRQIGEPQFEDRCGAFVDQLVDRAR